MSSSTNSSRNNARNNAPRNVPRNAPRNVPRNAPQGESRNNASRNPRNNAPRNVPRNAPHNLSDYIVPQRVTHQDYPTPAPQKVFEPVNDVFIIPITTEPPTQLTPQCYEKYGCKCGGQDAACARKLAAQQPSVSSSSHAIPQCYEKDECTCGKCDNKFIDLAVPVVLSSSGNFVSIGYPAPEDESEDDSKDESEDKSEDEPIKWDLVFDDDEPDVKAENIKLIQDRINDLQRLMHLNRQHEKLSDKYYDLLEANIKLENEHKTYVNNLRQNYNKYLADKDRIISDLIRQNQKLREKLARHDLDGYVD